MTPPGVPLFLDLDGEHHYTRADDLYVLYETRKLEQVNESFREVLDGTAKAPRLVFEF